MRAFHGATVIETIRLKLAKVLVGKLIYATNIHFGGLPNILNRDTGRGLIEHCHFYGEGHYPNKATSSAG